MNAVRSRLFSVLLAEDDDDDFYFIDKATSEVNPHAILKRVTDGTLLISELRSQTRKPSLLILDLNMPKLNGREVLRQLGELLPAKVPVVVITASNHIHEKEFCLQNGAFAFFTKPGSYSGYLEIMQQVYEAFQKAQLIEDPVRNGL